MMGDPVRCLPKVVHPDVAALKLQHNHLTVPGDVLSGHWSTSTSAGAAIVFLGDQSPVPTQDRIRGDDARDLRQDPPAEFVTAHSESTTLGVRQAKRPRAQVFSEDPILLPEIVDQIVLVTVHPASEREDEELQRRRHSLRLLGRLNQHRPSLGRFFAPYDLRLVGPDHRLGQGVIERIALVPDRRRTADGRETIRVLHRKILRAAIAMMHEAGQRVAAACVDGLLSQASRTKSVRIEAALSGCRVPGGISPQTWRPERPS